MNIIYQCYQKGDFLAVLNLFGRILRSIKNASLATFNHLAFSLHKTGLQIRGGK